LDDSTVRVKEIKFKMPAIKLRQLKVAHSKRRQQQYLSIDCPGQIGWRVSHEGSHLDHSCWHFATNYLKSYCRIERQHVNNHKTLKQLLYNMSYEE